ncbi:MAG TPA: ferrous iron transport protein B [Candidatus Brocadiia bacterium]|nr:ferrous iron transport protein B [Candidatus Brocadiia bacterium]
MNELTIALAGNPNAGKTSLFNAITGARQHVGNYPGVTVEKKEGFRVHRGWRIRVVDLPGAYSLTAFSADELMARRFIVEERPNLVVNVVDASNLERNLYLTSQLLELGAPLLVALNMSDLARARGLSIDTVLLSRLLGAAIVPTVGHKGQGVEELLDAVVAAAQTPPARRPGLDYGRDVERALAVLTPLAALREPASAAIYGSRWLSVKLLEHDDDARRLVQDAELLATADRLAADLERHAGCPPEILIAEARYGFISGVCREAVKTSAEARHDLSDRIDAILLSRALGLPIFLGLMYLVFHLTFTLAEPPMGWIETFFGWLGDTVSSFWPEGSESALRRLLVEGVISGVGGVLVFTPNILLLFLAIALLEDTGYMARAAFIMDRVMHKLGLHGKSFIPMLIGFGCTVPAIMATRSLEDRKDRLITMMVAPLMSCGARLPIYALIIPAFFSPRWRPVMLLAIYLLGVGLAVLSVKLLRLTALRGESAPLVMELPPYHAPTLRGVLIHMWERVWLYIRKAGTVILAASVLLWAMTAYPRKTTWDTDYAAQEREAREQYRHNVAQLNPLLGLPPASDTVWRALELERRAEQSRGAARRQAVEELNKLRESSEGEVLNRFLAARGAVATAQASFQRAVREGQLAEDSHECLALRLNRDHSIDQAREAWPGAAEAAEQYLARCLRPFEEAMAAIENKRRAEEMAWSVAGRIGRFLEPVLKPLGFDWRIGAALIGATAAKEVFVAQMGIVFAVGAGEEAADALGAKLRAAYSPLAGFCIMVFCLISAPCVATVAVTMREARSWRWALFQWGGLTAMAWVITAIVYQAGRLLGLGT